MSSEESKSSSAQPVNQGRRRFARAGVAAPAVLGTLASQPVLATTSVDRPPYHCTISGQLSGSTSRAPDSRVCSQMGRSPGYYKNNAWPVGGPTKGTLPSGSCSFSGGTQGTLFGGYSNSGKVLADSFRRKSVSGSCVIYNQLDSSFGTTNAKATMLEVLNTGGGLNDMDLNALGRATVATILNGIAWPTTYPLTPAKTIEMFNAVRTGGTYQAAPGIFWSRDQVLNYFKSLYS